MPGRCAVGLPKSSVGCTHHQPSVGSVKLRRDDFRHGFRRCHVPWEPHLTSHLQKSRGGMFIMARAGVASDSGAWGWGWGGGESSTTNCWRLLPDFVRSCQALAEKHLQLTHGK